MDFVGGGTAGNGGPRPAARELALGSVRPNRGPSPVRRPHTPHELSRSMTGGGTGAGTERRAAHIGPGPSTRELELEVCGLLLRVSFGQYCLTSGPARRSSPNTCVGEDVYGPWPVGMDEVHRHPTTCKNIPRTLFIALICSIIFSFVLLIVLILFH